MIDHLKSGCLYLIIYIGVSGTLFAQQPSPASKTTRPIAGLDSTRLDWTLALTPETSVEDADTLPDHPFHLYDPARREVIDWANLGNVGSAARPLFFQAPARLGLSVGVDAFRLYRLDPEDLRFHQSAKSFSEVFFHQGRNQGETTLRTKFSRTFAKGTNFSLDYRSINYLGQFRYQRVKNNTLNMGLHIPVNKRYDLWVIFNKTVMRQQENGGIVSADAFTGADFQGPIAAEVRLPDNKAVSRIGDQTFFLTQYYQLNRGDKRKVRLRHTLRYTQENYKFSDPNPVRDTQFFSNFLTDRRGVRHYIEMDRLENTVVLSTFRKSDTLLFSDKLEVGISHRYFNIRQEPSTDKVNNVFATGKLGLAFSKRLSLNADVAIGVLGTSPGEYQLNGELQFGLGKAGALKVGLMSQRYPLSLIQQQVYVTQQSVWNNANFVKPIENHLWAGYALPFIGLKVEGHAFVINNHVYYDTQGIAKQFGAAISVAQLIVQENLRWKALHLDNTLGLQQSNQLDDLLRLPKWFIKNSLYLRGRIFKKNMQVELGADFTMNASFRPQAWQPVTWQWQQHDTLTQKPYPNLDLFLAFKVKTFRFFVRYDNLSTLWNPGVVNYRTAWHPQQFGALRLGIAWRFFDSNNSIPNADQGSQTAPPSGVGSGSRPKF